MNDSANNRVQPLGAFDVVVGVAFLLAAALGYHLTLQTRFTGDGAGLCSIFHTGGTYYNVMYLPLAGLIDRIFHFEPFGALRWLSVGCSAIGVAGSYFIARGLGAGRRGAIFSTQLLALTYSVWFFATTVEIHAVHFAAIAIVGNVTLFGPWRRPALALALVALVFPLLYWTQQTSVLLGPGWVLLVQVARMRVAAPFSWRTLLLRVGPVLFVSLCFALVSAGVMQGKDVVDVVLDPLKQIGTHAAMPLPDHAWWGEWAKPLGVALPLAVVALFFVRPRSWKLLTFAVLLVPSIIFFASWGVVEDGGYFLPTNPFLFTLIAMGFDRFWHERIVRVAMPFLLVGQAQLSNARITAFDVGYDVEERIQILRDTIAEEPGSVLFAGMSDYAPNATIWLPELEQLELFSLIRNQSRIAGRLLESEEVWRDFVKPYLADAFTRHDRVLLELAHRHHEGRQIDPLIRELMAGVMVRINETYDVDERPHPSWGLAVIRQR